jgi:protein XRP2
MATKKKLNKADYMFKSKRNEVLVKKPGDINGIDFMIKDLHDCTVHILDYTAQI